MKYLIKESQFIGLIKESKFKTKDLCKTFGSNSGFCTRVESLIKESKKGGRNENLALLSAIFFKKVISDSNYFSTAVLEPGVPAYQERLDQLINFKEILEEQEVCPEIIGEVEKDIENLPNKKLKMTVTDDNQYSLLNRLDTHYTAKAYLLTHLMINAEDQTELNRKNETELRDTLKSFLKDQSNVDLVAGYLSRLLNEDESFRKYFMGSLEYSRNEGNKVESVVFDHLRKKYGEENVFEFSGDFGFVDHFGVDGVVVINGFAHPVQISSQVKIPKIFKYNSERCKPIGFYKSGSKIFKYEPEN